MSHTRRRRPAFTLMELLLVLAILVVIAAVAAPSISGLTSSWRLRNSADRVRAEWARARVAAMKSGRIHVFRYEIDGPHYQTEFWEADDTALEAGDDDAVVSDTAGQSSFAAEPKSLPDGVRFVEGDIAADAKSAGIEQDLAASPGASVAWSPPILFYSDGAASSAQVMLANDRGRAVTVTLRGLTGIARVGESEKVEGLER